ncbi:MAG: FeoB-associated Cys-rich membrane protein [Clostridiales bacterium]|nr:FeoB-associated Cys-rich membrane protein [Clostridiales bacterium]
MKPVDLIVIAILLVIVGAACFYIRKQKKKGNKCIGCPYGAECAARAAGKSCSSSEKPQQ